MSRPLNNMTDVVDAHRLLLLWVPRRFSRWKRVSWGVCLGRLWLQWTPDFNNSLDASGKLAMCIPRGPDRPCTWCLGHGVQYDAGFIRGYQHQLMEEPSVVGNCPHCSGTGDEPIVKESA